MATKPPQFADMNDNLRDIAVNKRPRPKQRMIDTIWDAETKSYVPVVRKE